MLQFWRCSSIAKWVSPVRAGGHAETVVEQDGRRAFDHVCRNAVARHQQHGQAAAQGHAVAAGHARIDALGVRIRRIAVGIEQVAGVRNGCSRGRIRGASRDR
jgi:hypothetical protein